MREVMNIVLPWGKRLQASRNGMPLPLHSVIERITDEWWERNAPRKLDLEKFEAISLLKAHGVRVFNGRAWKFCDFENALDNGLSADAVARVEALHGRWSKFYQRGTL